MVLCREYDLSSESSSLLLPTVVPLVRPVPYFPRFLLYPLNPLSQSCSNFLPPPLFPFGPKDRDLYLLLSYSTSDLSSLQQTSDPSHTTTLILTHPDSCPVTHMSRPSPLYSCLYVSSNTRPWRLRDHTYHTGYLPVPVSPLLCRDPS